MIHLTLTRKALVLFIAAFTAFACLASVAFVRTAQADHKFNDVGIGTFFHDSTAWLADNGIADGFEDGSFGTKKNITRGQASYWFENFNDNIVDPHIDDTTDVHGIADTSALATDADVASAVAAYNSAIEVVTATVPANPSTSGQQALPACPNGKRPISGGSSYVAGFYTAKSAPSGQAWHTVWEILPPSGGAAFPETTAYAVCVPDLVPS